VNTVKALFKFIFGLIVFLAIVAVVGRMFLFHIARTDSFSMIPNLVPGDYFLVSTRSSLSSGDIAVCRNPENPSSLVVLRVLAVPGMTISIGGNKIRIDQTVIDHAEVAGSLYYVDNTSGEHLEYVATLMHEYVGGHEYLAAFSDQGSDYNFDAHNVEKGLFLVGDNRNRARDSRHFGEVLINDCIGQAIMVIWPAEDSGELKRKDRILKWLL
jgi:signal peptidase I